MIKGVKPQVLVNDNVKNLIMRITNQREHLVEETLSSLDGIHRAKASPYLYTRLQAVLDQESKNFWQESALWLARPIVAFSAALLVFVINALLVYQHFSSGNTTWAEDQFMAVEYSYTPAAEETSYLLNEEQP